MLENQDIHNHRIGKWMRFLLIVQAFEVLTEILAAISMIIAIVTDTYADTTKFIIPTSSHLATVFIDTLHALFKEDI